MIKTYQSKWHLAGNFMVSGRKIHLTFTPLSNGGSYFTTKSEAVQKALEEDYQFGREYCLVSQQKETPKKEEKEAVKLETVTLPDLMAARDYVSKRFNVARSALKSKASIVETARQGGVDLIIE